MSRHLSAVRRYVDPHAVWALVVLLLLGSAVGGCSTDDPAESPPPPTTTTRPVPAPVSPSAPAPTGSTPVAGDDVAACADGRCRLAIREPTEIPLDDRLGVRGLTVSVLGDDRVLAVAEGGAVQTGGSVGSRLTLNGRIRIEVVSVRDGAAVISISPV